MKKIIDFIKKHKKNNYIFKVPISKKTDGLKLNLMVNSISEDRKAFEFQLKMSPIEKDKFENYWKAISEADKVPLYTFRCHRCKTLFLMTEYGSIVITRKGNIIDTPPICNSCFKRK